jgi:hypothetical protein
MMCVAIELDPGDKYNASMGGPSNAEARKIDRGCREENRPLRRLAVCLLLRQSR